MHYWRIRWLVTRVHIQLVALNVLFYFFSWKSWYIVIVVGLVGCEFRSVRPNSFELRAANWGGMAEWLASRLECRRPGFESRCEQRN